MDYDLPFEKKKNLFCAGLERGSYAEKVMLAVVEDDFKTLQCLISNEKVLPDFANSFGVTPLIMAAALGRNEAVELLAAHPLVALDRRDSQGMTALHHAAENGRAACVSTLLLHKARFDLMDDQNKTAFACAREEETQQAFYSSRDFARRYPQVTPVACEPPDEQLLYQQLRDALYLTGHRIVRDATCDALCEKLPDMPYNIFLKLRAEIISDIGKPFAWPKVFIAAAAAGRTDIMDALDRRELFDLETINGALHACIKGGDHPFATLWLLRRGADSAAEFDLRDFGKIPLHQCANILQRPQSLRTMLTWGRLLKENDINWHQNSSSDGNIQRGCADQNLRRAFRKNGKKYISARFNHAASIGEAYDASVLVVLYAEGMSKRAFTKPVAFEKFDCEKALSLALWHGERQLAQVLLADGYELCTSFYFFGGRPCRIPEEVAAAFLKEPRLPSDLPERPAKADQVVRNAIPWAVRPWM